MLRHTALLAVMPLLLAAAPPSSDARWHAEGKALFASIVAIPSVSDRPAEVKKLVAYLAERFRAAGFSEISIKDHDGTQSMIVRWRAGGKPAARPILLLGHLDVVEARRDDWSRDPFTLTEVDGYYYGRGATDMKNGIAAITSTLIRLKAEGFAPSRDIIVLFTGDEETDGNGARRAATEWRSEVDAEFALNADAGGGARLADGTALGFGLQTSEKMYQSYSLIVRNPGGHSSRPRRDNAIYELASALKALEAHRFTPQLNETTRAYFTARQAQEKGALGDAMRRWLANPDDGAAADAIEADPTEVGQTRTRCVATRLDAGHADNALPQLAKATVNCRIFPGIDAKAVAAELAATVGTGVTIEPIGESRPSPPSPLRADVVAAFTNAVHKRHPAVQIIPTMSTGATDGLFFRSTAMPVYGVDGTSIIVPDDERAHGRDERIPVKSFEQNLDHWYDMLRALAR